jgi:L-threonylcarbamoyladenylate synthase
VLERAGLPLAAPSANRSYAVSPTSAQHVRDSLGSKVAAIMDGGPCEKGLESTIVALREDGSWQVLRPGPIAKAELAALLGPESVRKGETVEAPGQLERHYSPGKPVRLNASEAEKDEFMLGFGEVAGDCQLSANGDAAEAAANLYACLHLAAASDKPRIAISPIPQDGIGEAIRDRLRRAATP